MSQKIDSTPFFCEINSVIFCTQCENLEILLPRRFWRKNFREINFFSKNVSFTNFLPKMFETKSQQFPQLLIRQIFRENKTENWFHEKNFKRHFPNFAQHFDTLFVLGTNYKRTYLILRIHNDKILPMNLKISDTKLLSVWNWLAIILHKVDLNQNSHFSNFFSFILTFLFCFQFRNWDVVTYSRC